MKFLEYRDWNMKKFASHPYIKQPRRCLPLLLRRHRENFSGSLAEERSTFSIRSNTHPRAGNTGGKPDTTTFAFGNRRAVPYNRGNLLKVNFPNDLTHRVEKRKENGRVLTS